MTVTTGLNETRIKCDSCPNTIDADEETARFEHDWDRCRESGLWTCPACRQREWNYWRRQFGTLARDYNNAVRDGEHDEARAIAFTAGVIDRSEK